jgi:hypothetical protein
VRRWVNAGVVSAQQGEDILRFERAGAASTRPAGTAAVRRLSPVAELVSYLGVVLVLVSGGLSVSRLWHGLGFGGRVAVGVMVAGLGFVGGRAIARVGDPSTTRLGWFLWLCGTGGVAMSTAVLVDRWSGHRSGWTVFVTGLVVLALSVGLWRNLERPLQFLSSVAGLCVSVAGLGVLANWNPSPMTVGGLVWIAAAGLALLAMKVVHPSMIALVVAQGGVFVGAMAMTSSSRGLGVALGLLSGAGGVALGLRTRRAPVTALGVVSFFVFTVRLLSIYLRGPGATLGAFVLGVALVGAVLWRATRANTADRDEGGADRHRKRLGSKSH